ncbi:MAG: glucosyltransferase domain-containing protein, partial [Chloroflexota bacterium]
TDAMTNVWDSGHTIMSRAVDRLLETLYTYRWQLVVLGVLSTVAYGFHAFNLVLAIDDWQPLVLPRVYDVGVMSQGRWMQRLQWALFGNHLPAPTFRVAFYIFSITLSAGIQLAVIGIRDKAAVTVYLFWTVLHPLHADSIAFEMVVVHVAILLASVAAACGAWAIKNLLVRGDVTQGILFLVASALLTGVAIASYQGSILVMIVVLGFVVIRDLVYGARPGYVFGAACLTVVIGLGGVVSWLVSAAAFRDYFDAPPLPASHVYGVGGTFIQSFADLSMTLRRFSEYFTQYLFLPQHLIPVFAKYVFIVMLLTFVVRGAMLTTRWGSVWGRVPLLVLGVGLLLLIPWTFGILRVPDNSLSYRGILSMAYATGLLVAGAVEMTIARTTARPLLLSLVWVVILVFVFQNNAASVVLYNNNQRDIEIAHRLIDIIENHPEFERLEAKTGRVQIYTVGRIRYGYNQTYDHIRTPNPMSRSTLTCGVWDCQPQRGPALLEYFQSGRVAYHLAANPYRFLPEADRDRFDEYLGGMAPFPSEDAIFVTPDDELLILLSRE